MLRLTDEQKKEKLFSYYGGEKLDFSMVSSQVGPGWTPLLEDICVKLFHLGWDGDLNQVKEKFGGLRFYFSNNCVGIDADIAWDVVAWAEEYSRSICEECGEYGEIRGPGWLRCLCEKCYEKEKA